MEKRTMENNTTKNINTAFSIFSVIENIILAIAELTGTKQKTITELSTNATYTDNYKNQLINEKSENINISIREKLQEISKNLVFLREIIEQLTSNTEIFSDNAVISACNIVSRLDSNLDNANIIKTLVKRFRGNFGALLLFYSLDNSEKDKQNLLQAILDTDKFDTLASDIEANIILLDSDLSDYNSVIIGLNRIIKRMNEMSAYFGFDFTDSKIKELSELSHDLELRKALNI